jgi:hypothetical protein
MAKTRKPRSLNPLRAIWDRQTADELYEYLLSQWKGMSALQTTPEDPSEIDANDEASSGDTLPPARADHTHPVNTAAPSVDVALGGATDPGTSGALLRSDVRFKLGQGGAVSGDTLISDGSSWVPTPVLASSAIMMQRVFSQNRDRHIPGPDDSQNVLAGRIFRR